jgi:hypothetical protein
MNERQAYEKHLADKLQQLPPPADMDRNWEQMRLLLDSNLPRSGGWGGNRWWITGIIAGLLLTGTWLVTQHFSASDQRQQPAATAATPTTAVPQQTSSAPGAMIPVTDQPSNVVNHHATGSLQPALNKPAAVPPPEIHPGSGTNDRQNNPPPTGQFTTTTKQPNATQETVTKGKEVPQNQVIAGDIRVDNHEAPNDGKPAKKETSIKKEDNAVVNPDRRNSGNGNINKTNEDFNKTGSLIAARKKKEPVATQEYTAYPSLVKQTTDDSGLRVQSPSQSITFNYAPAGFARTEIGAANTKSKLPRAVKTRTFAVGLSLPLAFPLGDQQPLSYNSNAGVNTVSDYIPAPHLQYHFNNKTYLQTEVQVLSPQFIRPILLYQNKHELSPGNYIYNSVYARKLYYLNIPVGIHHSPFKNFYLGTGLQFSSMLSGIALHEERKQSAVPGQGIVVNEQYARFSNDSLSHRFNGTEMRLLLDVNYYWQRFTVGLRYNQAFTNYVSFRLNNNTPYTYDKNKALQFYLRYNLWEDVKRKTSSKSLLSLK